jgi:hypothetical protein
MKKIEQKIKELETVILEGHVLKEKNLLKGLRCLMTNMII